MLLKNIKNLFRKVRKLKNSHYLCVVIVNHLNQDKMKTSNRNKKVAFGNITFGEAANHIGKRMTAKTHKDKSKYSRKGKAKFNVN